MTFPLFSKSLALSFFLHGVVLTSLVYLALRSSPGTSPREEGAAPSFVVLTPPPDPAKLEKPLSFPTPVLSWGDWIPRQSAASSKFIHTQKHWIFQLPSLPLGSKTRRGGERGGRRSAVGEVRGFPGPEPHFLSMENPFPWKEKGPVLASPEPRESWLSSQERSLNSLSLETVSSLPRHPSSDFFRLRVRHPRGASLNTISKNFIKAYRDRVYRRIQNLLNDHESLPPVVRSQKLFGTVVLRVEADTHGKIHGIDIVRRSDFSQLDEVAVALVRESAPFPDVSRFMQIDTGYITLTIPITIK